MIEVSNEFVDIVGHENYKIDRSGRVWSRRRSGTCGGILTPQLNPSGYYYINLGNSNKLFKVSRLVAKTFLPNPNNLPVVNHKNGIKTDDRLENLEWTTYSENTKHAFDTGLIPEVPKGIDHTLCKVSLNDLRLIKNSSETIRELGLKLNVHWTQISRYRRILIPKLVEKGIL